MTDIFSFWIRGDLTHVNYLCDRSFKEKGHNLIIYSYTDLKNLNAEIRDAREILPENEIYIYKYFPPSMQLGGFAERLKAEMVNKIGGTHIDLDVVALHNLDFESDYIFRSHPQGIVYNFVKATANSEFSKFYVEWTKNISQENSDWELSFKGMMNFFKKYPEMLQFLKSEEELGSDKYEYWKDFIDTDKIPSDKLKMIHFCGSSQFYQNYKKGSYYEFLLKQYNLV